jgi:hypothetical protein
MKPSKPNLEPPIVFVSITGLRVNKFYHYLKFFWLAVRAMEQARQSSGLIRVEARTINGVHHTMSIWDNESSMRKFLVTGAHLKAMQVFKQIATGKTVGFMTAKPPEWSQVHNIWMHDGQEV